MLVTMSMAHATQIWISKCHPHKNRRKSKEKVKGWLWMRAVQREPKILCVFLSVCVCVYLCVCVCLSVYLGLCMSMCVHECMRGCMHVCLCMPMSVCVCLSLCVSLHICVCLCACVNVCLCACMHVCMYVYLCTCLCLCVSVHSLWVFMHVCTFCMCMCVCMFVCVCIYAYICVCICLCVCKCVHVFSVRGATGQQVLSQGHLSSRNTLHWLNLRHFEQQRMLILIDWNLDNNNQSKTKREKIEKQPPPHTHKEKYNQCEMQKRYQNWTQNIFVTTNGNSWPRDGLEIDEKSMGGELLRTKLESQSIGFQSIYFQQRTLGSLLCKEQALASLAKLS
jgi:hypothetical protein